MFQRNRAARGRKTMDEDQVPEPVTCSGSIRLPQLNAAPQAEEEDGDDE